MLKGFTFHSVPVEVSHAKSDSEFRVSDDLLIHICSSSQTDGRRCGICLIVASADLHHPPVLPPQSDRPVRLHGNWVSARCEARPGVLFLTRRLTFHEDSRTWEGQYEHFSDPVCRHPTFSISASGRYTRGAPSAAVMGAVEFTFTGT